MKILRIIGSMAPTSGGPCQGIRNSIPELAKLGQSNEVVSLDASDSEFLRQDPFPIHALGPSRGPWAYTPKLLPWLLENLPRFDVVIIHGLWQNHGYAVRKALTTLRKSQLAGSSFDLSSSAQLSTINPQLSTSSQPSTSLPRCYVMPHGMLDPYFQREPSRRLKAVRNWIYWKWVESKVVNEADGILFTCEEEQRLARQTFQPYAPKQELNTGYGIAEAPAHTPEMESAFAAACPGLDGQPYLLFLSRIHPKKGVDLLIRAYAALANAAAAAYPSSSSNQPSTVNHQLLQPLPPLVIAGPLDSAYAREMQQLAAELLPPSPPNSSSSPLHSQPSTPNSSSPTINHQPSTINSRQPPQISFPGMLTGDAKWGAFHGCEAFILPSHQENFGIAVVEALACRKPVLISKQVNIWREITAAGGGTAEDNTLEGTTNLLRRWMKRAMTDESPNPIRARGCFEQHYSVRNAAIQLLSAIKN